MSWLKKLIRRIPDADAFLSFFSRLGAGDWLLWVSSIVGAAAMSLWAWAESQLPSWALAIVSLATLAILIWIASSLINAWNNAQVAIIMSKFDSKKLDEFGRDLTEMSREGFRFLGDRQRDNTAITRSNHSQGFQSHDTWQADRDFESVTGRLFMEKMGTRLLGGIGQLHHLGIRMPPHMISSVNYRPNGVLQFVGLMGDLLARGLLQQAIDLSQDRNFMWQIEH